MTDSQLAQVENTEIEETEYIDVDGEVFEEYYLAHFLLTQDKKNSYIAACNAIGYELPKHVAQAAYWYHKRLDEADNRVRKALDRAIFKTQVKAHNTIDSLLDAESESVKLGAARHITQDLYKAENTDTGVQIDINRDGVTVTKGKDSVHVETENSQERPINE